MKIAVHYTGSAWELRRNGRPFAAFETEEEARALAASLESEDDMEKTNKNGLTWAEWIAAVGRPAASSAQSERLVYAWTDGEDPTDYRAERLMTPSIPAPQPLGYDAEAVAKAFIRSHAERAAVEACVPESDVEISFRKDADDPLGGWEWWVRIYYQARSAPRRKVRTATARGWGTELVSAVNMAVKDACEDSDRVR